MSFLKAKPLPHEIVDYPITQFKFNLQPNKAEKIQEANDEYFVLNMAKGLFLFRMFTFYFGGGILLLFFLIQFIIKKPTPLHIYLIPLPFIILGLFHLAVYYYNPHKELVLDRMNGTISYPRLFFSKKQETVPFWLVTVYKNLQTGGDFTPMGYNLILRDRKQNFSWTLAHNRCERYWSFMVWYMDKNRPLPLGDIFDSYRQADFDRRLKEGFPKPLYPSFVPTDEHTPEQQAMRRRMAGW
ncbi:hypothetical protein MK851_13940 [Tenacibaculum sp. 1B UA]|jgi:hypothetical protein|uniref:hypothetical protein n=1 Tax=Tenacibaculum TaxID=104267 RepID=UPI002A23FF25|nr:hypothetical protein [Tenacibaculum sp. 1B UA]MDX8554718.1 hypothetical protein [Tenacibaculum sp. 1B UA]